MLSQMLLFGQNFWMHGNRGDITTFYTNQRLVSEFFFFGELILNFEIIEIIRKYYFIYGSRIRSITKSIFGGKFYGFN